MATNKEIEKRIEILEKEVQHLKAVLQYHCLLYTSDAADE